MLSLPNKWEHASFGRNKTSVELAQKNLAGLHCNFFYATPKQENFLCRKNKHYLPARVFLIKLLNVGWKISVKAISRPMSAIESSIQSWTKFAWCRLGNVRSASSCEASFLDLYRPSFLADVDCHYFRSISVKNIFLPRWTKFFLAE